MRVVIASDHGGYAQKLELASFIATLGHEVVDVGCFSEERCDYPDYADKAARIVASQQADRAVLICGTGIGMALTADKIAGVRAAVLQTPQFAELFRNHNDGNVACLSGRFVDLATNKEIVETFLSADFDGGRHVTRVGKIMREDDPNFQGVS